MCEWRPTLVYRYSEYSLGLESVGVWEHIGFSFVYSVNEDLYIRMITIRLEVVMWHVMGDVT